MTVVCHHGGVTVALDAVQPDGRAVLRIRRRPYSHPDVVDLVVALSAEQGGTYGYADPVEANPDDYAAPRGVFLVAYTRSCKPIACGGYRTHDQSGTVEVKKMYTRPSWRGRGIGRRILFALEQHAAASGARRIILETGVRNTAALALYTGAGYQPTDPYVVGRDPEINRAFVKILADQG